MAEDITQYDISFLSKKDFEKLPYKRAKDSLGLTDTKKKKIYIRDSQIPEVNSLLAHHEIEHLYEKVPTHDYDNDGVRYKSGSGGGTSSIGQQMQIDARSRQAEQARAGQNVKNSPIMTSAGPGFRSIGGGSPGTPAIGQSTSISVKPNQNIGKQLSVTSGSGQSQQNPSQALRGSSNSGPFIGGATRVASGLQTGIKTSAGAGVRNFTSIQRMSGSNNPASQKSGGGSFSAFSPGLKGGLGLLSAQKGASPFNIGVPKNLQEEGRTNPTFSDYGKNPNATTNPTFEPVTGKYDAMFKAGAPLFFNPRSGKPEGAARQGPFLVPQSAKIGTSLPRGTAIPTPFDLNESPSSSVPIDRMNMSAVGRKGGNQYETGSSIPREPGARYSGDKPGDPLSQFLSKNVAGVGRPVSRTGYGIPVLDKFVSNQPMGTPKASFLNSPLFQQLQQAGLPIPQGEMQRDSAPNYSSITGHPLLDQVLEKFKQATEVPQTMEDFFSGFGQGASKFSQGQEPDYMPGQEGFTQPNLALSDKGKFSDVLGQSFGGLTGAQTGSIRSQVEQARQTDIQGLLNQFKLIAPGATPETNTSLSRALSEINRKYDTRLQETLDREQQSGQNQFDRNRLMQLQDLFGSSGAFNVIGGLSDDQLTRALGISPEQTRQLRILVGGGI